MRLLAALALTLCAWLPAAVSEITVSGPGIHVGVLAYRGHEATLQRWQATADYLQDALPGTRFVLVPLDLQQMTTAVRDAAVDFVLTNPGNYVSLESRFGISRIVTLQNRPLGTALTRFGAVIFTRSDHPEIRTLADLRGASMMAVSRLAFGGFQMAWRRLVEAGIDPFADLDELRFAGFPQDTIVTAVLAGEVDSGTVRTDTLERMAAEGKLALGSVRVLGERRGRDFSFLRSTRLYPEWPFAKTSSTAESLAKAVAQALLAMPAEGRAAHASGSAGWTIPLDYSSVYDLFRALRIGPFQPEPMTWSRAIRDFGHWLAPAGFIVLVLVATTGYVMRTNRVLRRSDLALRDEVEERRQVQKELARHSELLEQRVQERTLELERVNRVLQADIEARTTVERQLTRNQRMLERLQGLGSAPATNHPHRLQLLLEAGCQYLDLAVGRLSRTAEDPYQVCAAFGAGDDDFEAGPLFPSRVAAVVASAEPASVDVPADGPVLPGGQPLRSWVGVPVMVSGSVRCVIEFADARARGLKLSATERGMLQLMAQWVGAEAERQESAEQTQRHQAELAHVARLNTMGEMASGLAHELNQPLTAVVNYTSGCLRRMREGRVAPAELAAGMERAVEGATRASKILTDLREFLRRGDATTAPVDLNEAISAVVRLMQSEVGQQGASMVQRLDRGIPQVMANRVQVEQVVVNLVKNALEAVAGLPSPQRQIEIRTATASGDRVEVIVSDNGSGVEPGNEDRIFDPFFTTRSEGMGLGLSISRSIAEAHHGSLSVCRPDSGGARFILSLPASTGSNS